MSPRSPNTDAVLSFLTLVTAGKIREAYDAHIHPEFFHHNQYHKGDRASLLAGMEENQAKFPIKTLDVKQLLENGDTVMTFSRLVLGGDMPEMAVVHIFRFEGDKIIEMWDIGQRLSADSPNENGAF